MYCHKCGKEYQNEFSIFCDDCNKEMRAFQKSIELDDDDEIMVMSMLTMKTMMSIQNWIRKKSKMLYDALIVTLKIFMHIKKDLAEKRP